MEEQGPIEGATGRESRRKLLALGAASAGALAMTAMRSSTASADGPAHTDHAGPEPAVHGNNTAGGPGVDGQSQAGHGVVGVSHHMDRYGVMGTNSTLDPDPGPPLAQGAGVYGQGVNIGVKAFSNDGHAVDATSTNGTAVDVGSLTGIGIGIHSGGTAIRVTSGKLKLNSVGAGTIPAGARSHAVAHAGVTANSHITVVLTSDPGTAAVQWVDRAPGASFTIHFTHAVRRDTTFTYFIVEPAFP